MTTYKEIFGKQIKQLSSDPTDSEAEGQVWYNTTAGVFKTVLSVGAWSSGGNLPQVVSYNSGAGTQTAALSIGGQEASTSAIQNTYEYDGSSWSDGGPVAPIYPGVSSYYGASCGTQTAALIVGGGSGTNATGEYNGSSWTATGNYPVTTFMGTANGIQTAAINIGGRVPPGSVATGIVANYNGSTWTASPVAISPAQYKNSSAGTSTATIVSGGITPSATVTTAQEWNGSSWTTVGAPSAPNSSAKSTGIQTLALKMYGTTGGTEQYNGSSWTTVANQAIVRDWATGGGSNDSSGATGVMFGGKTPSGSPAFTAATEEFTTTVFSPIAATWASGGALNTAVEQNQAFGLTQNAAISVGGAQDLNGTESYNGTSWTNVADMGTNRRTTWCAVGSQTAGLCAGGLSPPQTANSEEWNGSAWSEGNNLNTARYGNQGGGSQTSAITWSGTNNSGSTFPTASEEYNGTSWTNTNPTNTGMYKSAGAGTSELALKFGGDSTATESYDGTSWTTVNSLNTSRSASGGAGTQTLAIAISGNPIPAAGPKTELWNGTSWAESPASIGTARASAGGAGSQTSGLYVGGTVNGSTALTNTEEFTGATTVIKNLSTS
jgi:hypothetical protein